ncbi:hypothetical protein RJ55_08046 [Drechmeria coniospora]|nr:hypothetical protein RJ55_08046 [Drechmeria coniospora]
MRHPADGIPGFRRVWKAKVEVSCNTDAPRRPNKDDALDSASPDVDGGRSDELKVGSRLRRQQECMLHRRMRTCTPKYCAVRACTSTDARAQHRASLVCRRDECEGPSSAVRTLAARECGGKASSHTKVYCAGAAQGTHTLTWHGCERA